MAGRASESQALPPSGFRGEFAKVALDTTFSLELNVPRRPTDGSLAVIRTAIRDLLSAITTLALRYDDTPLVSGQRARYAANVMVFVPRKDSPPYFSEEVTNTLKFVEPELDRRYLRGVLQLRRKLSTHTDVEDSNPDPKIEPLALPIPETEEHGGKSRVLDGAPLAFTTGKAQGQDDVSHFTTWCKENGDFLQPVLEELTEYFKEHESIKSFIAWPLLDTDSLPFAVMNLHANRLSILGDRERAEIFQAMMAPFFSNLANCVSLLLSEEQELTTSGKADSGRVESADSMAGISGVPPQPREKS